MTNRHVSVIIPCHNGARFLAEAIDSVLAQTYPHYDIWVIDDGSTDHTAQVVACYGEVTYIKQPWQGLPVARNTGILASQGPYLLFLDDDDRLLPHALELGVDCLDRYTDCGMVYGDRRLMDGQGQLLQRPQPQALELATGSVYAALLSGALPVPPSRILFRRQVFDQVGLFDPTMLTAQDYDMTLRVAAHYRACWHNQVVVDYRQHDNSKTSKTPPSRLLYYTHKALDHQWPNVRKNPIYRRAYFQGKRHFGQLFGQYLPYELAHQIKQGHIPAAIATAGTLLRHHPQALVRYGAERSTTWARWHWDWV